MCVGCRQEWGEMLEGVRRGLHIATSVEREFVVPGCLCDDVLCGRGPHFFMCLVDDVGDVVVW